MGKTKYDFAGRVAVVTGGAKGIGRGIALGLAEGGARVYILDNDEEKGAEATNLIREAGGRGDLVACDVTQSAAVKTSFEHIANEAGRLDILVQSAGGFWKQTVTEETTEEEWDHVVNLNLKGTFLCARAAIPAMRKEGYGRIIHIGSMSGVTTMAQASPPYGAAKAGVHALARTLAFELGKYGITANAIAPGTTATERVVAVRTPEQMKQIGAATLVGRIAEVDDMVGSALFLASEEAGYITGQTLYVNGGRYMH